MNNIADYLGKWGYMSPRLVGEGAFSKVYRVKERASGCIYACKVSDKQEMLRREGETLQRISHPLFPAFHDFRQQEKLAFLFMEFVPGVSLKTLLTGRGALSERRAVEIAVELAKGLEYLHELDPPVLFRDLKPENIMIKENGNVKLLDLGSAGVSDTAKHVITGTWGFAAPEQWERDGSVGSYSDVYGLAKVMYYMMGKMHRGVKLLLEDCLRQDIRERIPDMRCFLRRLEPYRSGRKGEILKSELSAYLRRGDDTEYIFLKNILK